MAKLLLIKGDALEVLKYVPSAEIDLIITDPPFMISRNDKITRKKNSTKYKFKGKDISLNFGEWDIFASEKDYWKFTFKWLKEAWRSLRKGGHLLIFFDHNKIYPIIKWCSKRSGIPRQPLFFIRSNPTPMARKVSFMNAVNSIIWITKYSTSRKYATFNYELGQHPNYIITPICSGKERYEYGFHPTQKPLKVYEWLIKYLSNENDLIMDPFVGSGTALVAARNLNRNAIGIEINDEYINMTKQRVAPGQRDLFGEFKFKYFDWSEDKAHFMQEFIKNIKTIENGAGDEGLYYSCSS